MGTFVHQGRGKRSSVGVSPGKRDFEIVSHKNYSQVVAVCRWGVHNTITQQLGFLSQTRLRLKDPMECIQSRIQVVLLSFTRDCPNRLGYSFVHLRLKTETLRLISKAVEVILRVQ